ncbi:MAG: hypothetical protein NW207_04820 [Cytophagales bacterium]|nr:hypothetical protein [Cytophagales bacterium]
MVVEIITILGLGLLANAKNKKDSSTTTTTTVQPDIAKINTYEKNWENVYMNYAMANYPASGMSALHNRKAELSKITQTVDTVSELQALNELIDRYES